MKAMKTLTVRVGKEQMNTLLTETHRGDLIVLTDGDRRLELEAAPPFGGAVDLDLEADSPELEVELLKAVQGAHGRFSETELRSIASQAREEHTTRRPK